MAQLFVPLTGAFKEVTGSGFNTFGENLDRPLWRGAEIGGLDTFPDVLGAVSEAEFHDWIIGVHHPLFKEGGSKWPRFFDPSPAVRAEALEVAARAAQQAHHVGARYILFHFPWPGFTPGGANPDSLGWYYGHPLERLEDWQDEAEVREVSRRAMEHLAAVQAEEKIQVVLEIDGPNPYFYEGDLWERLFSEYPELSLCVDTGRLGLLARTHGQDPLALMRRWLPFTRYMHLHTSKWDEQGQFLNHLPTDGTHTAQEWPRVTPAADMARMLVKAQPRAVIVLEHNPKGVAPEELEAAHAWSGDLVGGGL